MNFYHRNSLQSRGTRYQILSLPLDDNHPMWNIGLWLQRNSESEPPLISVSAIPLKATQPHHFTPPMVCASLYLASIALIGTYALLN